ncbi:MAG: endonuclease/exonuclease/phosphatase, partial [Lutibacter sp.]|nr:endonuclease/exonuclease/phosphatase [Lutibacter sp.]
MNKIVVLLFFIMAGSISNSQSLDVMTYNIRLDVAVDGENAWPFRKEYFISQIQFYEPDIFGIQEARPNQVADISNGLSQYSQVGMGR